MAQIFKEIVLGSTHDIGDVHEVEMWSGENCHGGDDESSYDKLDENYHAFHHNAEVSE